MTAPNDGGPAFPLAVQTGNPHCEVFWRYGMSLRDWFAGQALAGICSGFDDLGNATWTWDAAAVSAYSMADAMLAEREKGQK